jgi:hypothetical protein
VGFFIPSSKLKVEIGTISMEIVVRGSGAMGTALWEY